MKNKIKQTSNQSLFDALKNIAPIVLFEFQNNRLHIKKINKPAAKIIGYTKKELQALNLYDLLDQQSKTNLQKRTKEILIGAAIAKTTEYKIRTKDGRQIHAIFNLRPQYEKGKLKNILSIIYDLTQTRKAQEELQKSAQITAQAKQELNIILDSIPTIIFYKNKNGKIKLANQAFAKALHTTKEQLIGKTVFDLYSKKIAHAMKNDDLIVMKTKKPKLAIIEAYESPTGIKWIKTDKIPSYSQNGKVNGIIGFSEDITERKKAQEELIESEQKYRMLIETAAEGIVLTQPYGKFIFTNNKFAQMTGYTLKEILKKSTADFLIDEKHKTQVQENRKKLQKGKYISGEFKFKRKDNTNLWVAYNASPLFDKEGNHIANMALYTDITERKKMETQLKEKERLAAIGETAAMVGHDIRNPLQAIMSDNYLLKTELTSMPSCRTKNIVTESIQGIEDNINYINKIVSDLQDYAKPLNPTYTTINLPETIDNLTKSIEAPINIKTKLRTKTKTNELIQTDSTFLRRILTNLINNAIQAMPKGGKLTLTVNIQNDKTTITISDTGIGIPEEIKPKLFTPMITTKAKGQGLGLAVVKRLVEALNGTITFTSVQQKGTKFTIQLPNSSNNKNSP